MRIQQRLPTSPSRTERREVTALSRVGPGTASAGPRHGPRTPKVLRPLGRNGSFFFVVSWGTPIEDLRPFPHAYNFARSMGAAPDGSVGDARRRLRPSERDSFMKALAELLWSYAKAAKRPARKRTSRKGHPPLEESHAQ